MVENYLGLYKRQGMEDLKNKILVVDDESNIVNIISYNLKKEGYEVIAANDGETGLDLAIKEQPDLILLDIMMPGMDGYDVCRSIRSQFNMPIIMLTARADEIDKVLGLEMGADDYVTKPFSNAELLARVKAHLRRKNLDSNPKNRNVFEIGEIQIDLDRYEVKKRGEAIEITVREFELINFLAAQKGQVFTREALLSKVWGYEYFGDVRTVDVTIRRLREKVEDDPSNPKYIITKRGVGYYFEPVEKG